MTVQFYIYEETSFVHLRRAVSAKYVILHILRNDKTLLGSFLLAQKFIWKRLTRDKMMGAKLHPLANP